MEITKRSIYENSIRSHANYDFIPVDLKKSWVCVSKKGVNSRKQYWTQKLKELIESRKLNANSNLADVARYIHPTKIFVCQICHGELSVYYEYPNVNTWKWLKQTFGFEADDSVQSIFNIYGKIESPTKHSEFSKYFGKSIEQLETDIKNGDTSSKLSPGVMSNPPDRLDGFHSYSNICGCRSRFDKGRSHENMKSYTRDRRAYELFSDGRVLLANAVMGEVNKITRTCVGCNNPNRMMTADHIGPISLGFVHDPSNFQACCSPCNSAKNNRITQKDVDKIKSLDDVGINVVSWWARDAWENCKNTTISNIQETLDTNTKKFLKIVEWLKQNKLDVLNQFIETYMNHSKSYKITVIQVSSSGDIGFNYEELASEKKTKDKQKERTMQILSELDEKKNRKTKVCLSDDEIQSLSSIDNVNFKNTICTILASKL
jgi:Alw26I/Eco31I/Esp3I family type II restriction endonuclease